MSGEAMFREPFCEEYKWQKKGSENLLLLAHPLHLMLLSNRDSGITVLGDFKYISIDGDLVGVIALCKDVNGLNSSIITTTSSYFYGKLVARAARLALIAKEMSYLDMIPKVSKFLKETVEPWLEQKFDENGRNQESTSEVVSAYYSATLMSMTYGDESLVSLGSTLMSLEILGAKMWWHVEEGDNGLWFGPANGECRLDIQLLPLVPISEALFSYVGYVKELVKWTLPALNRDGVGEGWKGFDAYALEGIYDKESAWKKIKRLKGFDYGNSLTNLLWWIYSRGDE
ncbi:hypothetical protein glysoja_049687 [Glycine soja]|uniref:glucan endo-1,3-beta-D-glucosidase n=1 Tax=Glycine soja TaxID=3848 RepID=A0A0B2PPE7_GLYSO|nr:hypothetical protein glysoja_049687 [Glycine soja]